jgi:hypothetical protein
MDGHQAMKSSELVAEQMPSSLVTGCKVGRNQSKVGDPQKYVCILSSINSIFSIHHFVSLIFAYQTMRHHTCLTVASSTLIISGLLVLAGPLQPRNLPAPPPAPPEDQCPKEIPLTPETWKKFEMDEFIAGIEGADKMTLTVALGSFSSLQNSSTRSWLT